MSIGFENGKVLEQSIKHDKKAHILIDKTFLIHFTEAQGAHILDFVDIDLVIM